MSPDRTGQTFSFGRGNRVDRTAGAVFFGSRLYSSMPFRIMSGDLATPRLAGLLAFLIFSNSPSR